MWSTLAYLVFRKIKSPTYCAKAKEYTLAHCLLAPLKKFPSSDANPVQSPLAELCAPCVPSGTWENHPQPSSYKTTQGPRFAPRKPRVAGFCPRWGKRPLARSGAGLGPTGASLAEVTGEARKPVPFFCFSQAGNKTHRSLKPTHSSLLGRASRAPARRCRSAQKAGRSRLPARSARGGPHRGPSPLHPLCRKERSL